MIFLAVAGPTPGRVSRSFSLALFKSIFSPLGDCRAEPAGTGAFRANPSAMSVKNVPISLVTLLLVPVKEGRCPKSGRPSFLSLTEYGNLSMGSPIEASVTVATAIRPHLYHTEQELLDRPANTRFPNATAPASRTKPLMARVGRSHSFRMEASSVRGCGRRSLEEGRSHLHPGENLAS